MNTYTERKAARKAAYVANLGKPQARRVFRVYATSAMGLLPENLSSRAMGAFASKADADAFAYGKQGSQHDICSYEQAPAWKALENMLPRGSMCVPCYVRFHVATEEA